MSTWSLLTSSAVPALPTCGPPTRKYTSDSVVGFPGEPGLVAVLAAHPQQDRRLLEAGVDGHARDDDAGNIGDVERGRRRRPP